MTNATPRPIPARPPLRPLRSLQDLRALASIHGLHFEEDPCPDALPPGHCRMHVGPAVVYVMPDSDAFFGQLVNGKQFSCLPGPHEAEPWFQRIASIVYAN